MSIWKYRPMKKGMTLLMVFLMIIGMNLAGAEEVITYSGDTLSEQVEGLHVNIQHMADSPEWVVNLPAA